MYKSSYLQRGGIALVLALGGCKLSSVLNVAPPSSAIGFGSVTTQAEVEAAYNGAKGMVFAMMAQAGNIFELTGTLSDELTDNGSGDLTNIDARFTIATATNPYESGDGPLTGLYSARSALLLAVSQLRQVESPAGLSKVGEAYALLGYIELSLAEDYCAGAPLSYVVGGGGYVFGTPLTTDSLLGVAEAHFDSAIANAHQNDTISNFANVGLGRTLVDRQRVDSAGTVMANVPVGFVYNVQSEPSASDGVGSINLWANALPSNTGGHSQCQSFNVADREGGNGVNFVSAHDPRLMLDSMLDESCGGLGFQGTDSVYYYPIKFGDPISSGLMPLATGLEAALVVAEAKLAAHDPAWLTDLNALRTSGCTGNTNATCAVGSGQVAGQPSGVLPLADPGTDSARVRTLFWERAFWLYGTGTRLGDMRRMIRQYGSLGFTANTVFPYGPYPHGGDGLFPTYGPDVNFTLPTVNGGYPTVNTNYKGCLTSTTTA